MTDQRGHVAQWEADRKSRKREYLLCRERGLKNLGSGSSPGVPNWGCWPEAQAKSAVRVVHVDG